MIDIHLFAILPDSEEEEVGQFLMERVPQVGEYIRMYLHIGYQSRDEQEGPAAHTVQFRVEEVTTIAHNILQTEQWFTPHSHNTSNYVTLRVTAADEDARRYLFRLVHE